MKAYLVEMLLLLLGRRLAWRLGRALYQSARYEAATTTITTAEEFVQQVVIGRVDELVLVDVGANTGSWSGRALSLLKGRHCLLLAFEPDKDAMIELKSRLNSDSCVRFVARAVGPSSGVIDFYVTTPAAGTNTVVPDSRRKALYSSRRVPMISLPDAFEEHRVTHAHLVKIDAEGFDFEILRGARPLLEQERISLIQFEYNHRWIFSRRYLFDVFALIEDLPYVVGKVTRSRLEVYKEWHPEIERYFESNYLCLHKDALSWFPHTYVSWNKSNTLISASRGELFAG